MFNLESPFWNALGKLCDLIILNVLFVICCLPIVTIGASVSALYTVLRKMSKDEGGTAATEFWKALKSNLKQATILWLLMLPIGLLTVFEMYLLSRFDAPGLWILKCIFVPILILWIVVVSYLFPVQSRFESSVKGVLKNAVLLSIYHLIPWSLVIVLLNLLPWILLLLFSEYALFLIQFMCGIGFVLIAGLNYRIFEKIFQKYIDAKTNES